MTEDSSGAVQLAEGVDGVGANAGAVEDERNRVAGMDDVGIRRRRVVAGHAHDRPIGRQVAENGVERLDRPLLDRRVLRVPGHVGRFQVREDERVALVEPLEAELGAGTQIGRRVTRLGDVARLEPDRPRQAEEEPRVAEEALHASRGAP